MSRALQPTPTKNQNAGEEVVWPEFAPSPGYRSFIERLRRARIERGLSLSDMADLVGLYPKLAREFEDATMPLPFCHFEIWCQVVGVPFEDYLAIYWAEMEVLFEAQETQAQETQAQETQAQEKAACITNTENSAPTPALSRSDRGGGFLNLLRSVFAHISKRFLSLFSTRHKTPKYLR